MSVLDKCRRRRRLDDEGEDEDTAAVPSATRPSECESEGEGVDVELSEHESAVDGADPDDETEEESETETEEGSESEEETGSETETEGGEGYTDEEGLEEERQSGDGEEQPDNDKPDDDEDKKNPAYVPRKGAFYEHDFRQGDEEPEKEEGEDPKPKTKLWQDEGKWSHDRYIDEMQAPKSREELIAIYGYDIRAADKPPDAPPRRTGRGKGPRGQRFQDFVPRMAVIDTTEDGYDSVPNLGEDEVIVYNEPSSRHTRRNNIRNETWRGGRGVGRGRGRRGLEPSGHMDSQNFQNYSDYNKCGGENKNNQDNRREIISQGSDFPSLEESSRQIGTHNNRSEKNSDTTDHQKSDVWTSERSQKAYLNDSHDGNRRGEYRDDNSRHVELKDDRGSYQDNRRQENNNHYRQGQREERRAGYNNRPNRRDGHFSGHAQEENWRSGQSEVKDVYSRLENNGGSGRSQQEYGYNWRQHPPQQQYGGDRIPRAGIAGDAGSYSGSNKRNNRAYEQPARYQQQQVADVASAITREPKEYTNSSYKVIEDKLKPRGMANAGDGDNGDGSVSSSKNVVISNKENVQTINVTITSTTTEKKSYAKERRAKGARPAEGTGMTTPTAQHAVIPPAHYPGVSPASVPPVSGTKRYSSQRQQGLGKGVFIEPPSVGAKLYNPALPPPSFFQGDSGAVAAGQHPVTSAPASVQDPTHFAPTLLPPTAATLSFGLPGVPVSSTGLALPPTAAVFQPPPSSSIPAPGTALMAPPYLASAMMYGGAPRVPPPGGPTGFPMPMAYTSPPPAAPVSASVVGTQPPTQGTAPQQGLQTTAQHKKVYRGDITYYAPELQQPSRTAQRRPKAAIPIIDPQEIRKQKQKEKSEARLTPEKSMISSSKPNSPSPAKLSDSTTGLSSVNGSSQVTARSEKAGAMNHSVPAGSNGTILSSSMVKSVASSPGENLESTTLPNESRSVFGNSSPKDQGSSVDVTSLPAQETKPLTSQSFKSDLLNNAETMSSDQRQGKVLDSTEVQQSSPAVAVMSVGDSSV